MKKDAWPPERLNPAVLGTSTGFKLIESFAQAGLHAVHVAIEDTSLVGDEVAGDASISHLALRVRGADNGSELCIVAVVLMQGETLQASSLPPPPRLGICVLRVIDLYPVISRCRDLMRDGRR